MNINLSEKSFAKFALKTYCVTLNCKAGSIEKDTFNRPIFQLHVRTATMTYSNCRAGLNLSCRI